MINIVVDSIAVGALQCFTFFIMRRNFGLIIVVLWYDTGTIFFVVAIILAFPTMWSEIAVRLNQTPLHGHMLCLVFRLCLGFYVVIIKASLPTSCTWLWWCNYFPLENLGFYAFDHVEYYPIFHRWMRSGSPEQSPTSKPAKRPCWGPPRAPDSQPPCCHSQLVRVNYTIFLWLPSCTKPITCTCIYLSKVKWQSVGQYTNRQTLMVYCLLIKSHHKMSW